MDWVGPHVFGDFSQGEFNCCIVFHVILGQDPWESGTDEHLCDETGVGIDS